MLDQFEGRRLADTPLEPERVKLELTRTVRLRLPKLVTVNLKYSPIETLRMVRKRIQKEIRIDLDKYNFFCDRGYIYEDELLDSYNLGENSLIVLIEKGLWRKNHSPRVYGSRKTVPLGDTSTRVDGR